VNSPGLIFMKVGIILLLACFAFLWTRHMNPAGWSFVRQLGTTSLLVYWVHTELVYGRWFGVWKESLSVPQTAAMAAFIIVLMIGLSVARTGWKGRPGMAVTFRQQWNAWRAEPINQPAGD
jgi:fucose 4-O-acetylase-like acetyltransferase